MARPILSEQTTTEYFKELVEEALSERHLQAGDLTEYYLVNLLCQYVRPDSRADHQEHDRAAGIPARTGARERRSRTAGPPAQPWRLLALHVRLLLRQLPPQARGRRLLQVDGRVRVRLAEPLGTRHVRARSSRELARKFVGFMDVLAHISERTAQRTLRQTRHRSASTRSGCGPAACATASG